MKGKNWVTGSASALILVGSLLGVGCKSSSTNTSATQTYQSLLTPAGSPAATDTPATTPAATSSTSTSKTPSAQSQVDVTLVEYRVAPKVTSVPAGSVTFNAKNIGTTQHTLVVVKTDAGPTALPTKADGSYDGTAAGATVIDQVQPIDPQGSGSLTVNLQPGHYVLICNVVQTTNGQTVSHYAQGMATDFTITQ